MVSLSFWKHYLPTVLQLQPWAKLFPNSGTEVGISFFPFGPVHHGVLEKSFGTGFQRSPGWLAGFTPSPPHRPFRTPL